MQTKNISIIIPTINEVEGIRRGIKEIQTIGLETLGYRYEILVVDGGSDDGTIEVAKKLGAKLIIQPNRGYGKAYKTGFPYARGDIIVTLDGDGQYPPEFIPRLVKILIDGNYDFITTNRFAYMEPGSMTFLHKVGNKVLSLLIMMLFGINLKDSQSGMWVFRKDVLGHIIPDSNGMSFSEEIKIKAFLNAKSIEIPSFYRRRVGKSKLKTFKDGISNMIYLFVLWLKLRLTKRQDKL